MSAPSGTAIDGGSVCPCEVVTAFEQPIASQRAEAGDVTLAFYALDVETVRDVVASLQARFDSVALRRLSRRGDDATDDPVSVDRKRLTDRQRETLRMAHELGYFGRKRRATGQEVAAALDISLSTFTEHVGAGLEKVLAQLFDDA